MAWPAFLGVAPASFDGSSPVHSAVIAASQLRFYRQRKEPTNEMF
jgi:hypothetical protein